MEILQRQTSAESSLGEDIHPVLRRIYAARGVLSDAELRLDLTEMHPPGKLKDIDQAASLLAEAMAQEKSILVVGDFDADGATSSALFVLCMQAFGHLQVDFLVPNRFEFGYGLTPEIVEVARQASPDLIVTVDNGIASFEGVSLARQSGVDVLVTDHHLPASTLPEANCIVNPNQPDCNFPSKALAGVGVVFYLMTALRAELRERHWFASRQMPEPNMAAFLDLVALGTVADVVPLDQNNRRLVKHGLAVIRSGKGRPGIRALLEVAGKNPDSAVASDLAFCAGPRLNAAGRLDDMSLGIDCLLADRASSAVDMARQLDELNRDRKQIEQGMQTQALEALTHLNIKDHDQLGICIYDAGWHQGVIGILASRLKEKYHRPCIVFANAGRDEHGNKLIKGSGRSIEGLHLRDALDLVAKKFPQLLSRFGGHAMAAGMAIREADFEAFAAAFETVLAEELDRSILRQLTLVDGTLTADCLNLDFAAILREAGPWGQHFPEPLFTGDFRVASSRVVGEKHLKLTLQPIDDDALIDAIAFNVDSELLEQQLREISLVYRLDVNEFRGVTNPQLIVDQIIDYRAG